MATPLPPPQPQTRAAGGHNAPQAPLPPAAPLQAPSGPQNGPAQVASLEMPWWLKLSEPEPAAEQLVTEEPATTEEPEEPDRPWLRPMTPEEEAENLKGVQQWLIDREKIQVGPQESPARGNRIMKTGADVLACGHRYLEWCSQNPIPKTRTETYQGESFTVEETVPRVPTVQGWAAFIGITSGAIYQWQHKEEEYAEATATILNIIRTRQIEGGAAGIYNAQIAMRLAGLADKSEQVITNPPPAPRVNPLDAVNCVHPDDPDPLAPDRLLFSQRQIDAGVPYPIKTISND